MARPAYAHHAPAGRPRAAFHLGSHAGRRRPAQPADRVPRGQLHSTRVSGRGNPAAGHSLEKACKSKFYFINKLYNIGRVDLLKITKNSLG